MSSNLLAILISMISLKTNTRLVVGAIKLLHGFLQNDPATFKNFKPNKPLLRKMDLSNHIMSNNNVESESTLDLCGFIMRYHRSIDYGDFSDSPYTVQRLRRYMEFKQWAEIEEL